MSIVNNKNAQTVNKQFEYRGYNFNIKVEMNTKVEKRIGGKRWHTITCNCLGHDNYYEKYLVLDNELEFTIFKSETLAKSYVDRRLDDNTPLIDQRLKDLGFS